MTVGFLRVRPLLVVVFSLSPFQKRVDVLCAFLANAFFQNSAGAGFAFLDFVSIAKSHPESCNRLSRLRKVGPIAK